MTNGFAFAADGPPSLLLPTLSISSTNPTCGKSNGSIVASAAGGTAPYTFRLNTNAPQTSGIFTRLGPGSYSVTVTDAANQTATVAVVLTNQFTPPTGVTTQFTRPSGCTTEDATLTLTGVGGTPPYNYSIDRTNFQASNVFTNLSAGAYICAVTDANGCQNPYLWWNTTNVPENCIIRQNGQNRSYTCGPFRSWLGLLNVSGGTPPYQYSLNGINFQANSDFYPLPGGLYTVTVKDATGALMKFSVALYDECNPLFSVAALTQPANCGLPNGSITVSATEGTAPYQYSLDGVNFQAPGQFTGLTAGTYTVTVKDANNLVSSKLVIVTASCLVLNATPNSSTCGNPNGSINVQVSGGTAPYRYSTDGVNFQTINILSGLASGLYTVTVKDAAGGTGTLQVTVGDIAGPVLVSLEAAPTGCSGASGSVAVTAQSGTPPLQYSLNGGPYQTGGIFPNLPAGNYRITVKDARGCLNTDTVSVTVTNDIAVDAGNDATICEGGKTLLAATSNASLFSWSPATGLGNSATLQPGASPAVTTTYVLTATQGACSRKDSVIVTVNKAPVATTGGDTTICFGKNLALRGGGGLTYSWSPTNYLDDPLSSLPLFTPPAKGTFSYTLQVKDAFGCSSLNAPASSITVIAPLVNAGRDTVIAANHPFQLTADDPGGAGFVDYDWSPSTGLNNPNARTPVATVNQDVVFTVKATTAAGCVATDFIRIKVYKGIEIYVPTAFTPNGDGRNDVLMAVPVGIKQFRLFSVFNRWGETVFQTNDPATGWNGKFGGVPQNGVFVWIAEGVDYSGNTVKRRGSVVLIR